MGSNPTPAACNDAVVARRLHLVTRGRAFAALAVLLCLATFARATRCSAGGEVLVGVVLTAIFAALWNDEPASGLPSRIAKFIVVGLLIGAVVGLVAVAFHVRCVSVV